MYKNIDIDFEDFNIEEERVECEFEIELWGNEDVSISLNIDFKKGKEINNINLKEHIHKIEKQLQWIEENRHAIEKAIIDYGMVQLAEEWVRNGDKNIVDGNEYYLNIDDEVIQVPITKEQFCKSLYIGAISIDIDEDYDNYSEEKNESYKQAIAKLMPTNYVGEIHINSTFKEMNMDIFLGTEPDYFAYHSIEVFIDEKHNIKVNGLAG